MTTQNMSDFMSKNKTNLVVFGERQTPEGTQILTKIDMDRSDRLLYRFDDGEEFTLLGKDAQSAPDFMPAWAI